MKHVRLLMLIVLGTFVLAACNQDEEEVEEERIVPIEVTEVETGDITDTQTVYGRTTPIKTTPIMIEAPGEVDKIEAKSGDTVTKDDHLATIQTQAGDVRIKAPADGELAQFSLKEDDVVSGEDPVGMILDTDEMEITLEVTSDVRSLFKPDKKHDTSIRDKSYEAKVDTIDSLPNDHGLYDIMLTFKNKKNKVIAGDIAGVEVTSTIVKDELILPTEAIIEENEGAFVYVITDDKAKKLAVDIIEMRSDFSAIKGDLAAGDEVAVNGQLTLEDGSKVEIVEEENES